MRTTRQPTRQPTMAALELRGVFQHVAGRAALLDIELRLERHEWLLVVGPNGAGKSLLSRLALGLDRPSAGQVWILGQEANRLGQAALLALRRDIGAVLQGGRLLGDATVIENLLLPLRQYPLGRERMARAARLVIALLQLDGLEDQLPRALSLGQQRRVELARALIHQPRLLVWDSIGEGLDAGGTRDILRLLQSLRPHRPLALLATSHDPELIGLGWDRVAVLERGQRLFAGVPDALPAAMAADLAVRAALGGHP